MSSSFFAKFSKPVSNNSLGVTTKEARELAQELRMRIYVIYFPDTDEFDYTEVKPDPSATIMRVVRPTFPADDDWD